MDRMSLKENLEELAKYRLEYPETLCEFSVDRLKDFEDNINNKLREYKKEITQLETDKEELLNNFSVIEKECCKTLSTYYLKLVINLLREEEYTDERYSYINKIENSFLPRAIEYANRVNVKIATKYNRINRVASKISLEREIKKVNTLLASPNKNEQEILYTFSKVESSAKNISEEAHEKIKKDFYSVMLPIHLKKAASDVLIGNPGSMPHILQKAQIQAEYCGKDISLEIGEIEDIGYKTQLENELTNARNYSIKGHVDHAYKSIKRAQDISKKNGTTIKESIREITTQILQKNSIEEIIHKLEIASSEENYLSSEPWEYLAQISSDSCKEGVSEKIRELSYLIHKKRSKECIKRARNNLLTLPEGVDYAIKQAQICADLTGEDISKEISAIEEVSRP